MKTNVGRTFLHLNFRNIFARNSTIQKIFCRNTIKISYSCLRNISTISSHNCNILSPKQQSFGCKCGVKNEYLLNGECQTSSVIDRVDVVNDYFKLLFFFNLQFFFFIHNDKPKNSNSAAIYKHSSIS